MKSSLLPFAVAALAASCVFAEPASQPASTRATTGPSVLDVSGPESPIANPVHKPRSLKRLKDAPLYSFSEDEVDVYLKYLSKEIPDPFQRVLHLAKKNIGQPYEIYLLGEAPFERYDPDPMYCLAKSDCVTFIENTFAMALSRDWNSYFNTLQRLRYKSGKVGMLTRNHESVTDWTPNNAWLFDDITATVAGDAAAAPMHMLWKPSKFFAQFGIGQDLPDVEFNGVYIPRDKIQSILPQLRPCDLIHIVRGTPGKDQWVGHFALCTVSPDGTVNMLHSAEPAVREQPILDYLAKNPKTIGIRVLRPKADPQQVVDHEMGTPGRTPTASNQ